MIDKKTLKILATIIVSLLTITVSPAISQAQVTVPREETLIYSGHWGDHNVWNPLIPGNPGGHYLHLIYDVLFIYSPVMEKWMPWLAEGYRWVDQYTFEVKIRPQARWWDGQPVTADDVKYTFDLNRKYWGPTWNPGVASVVSIDAKTVRFVINKTSPVYFHLFSVISGMYILPKHRWEKLEAQYGTEYLFKEFKDSDISQIVGSGMYKPIYSSPDRAILQRDDNWWGKDLFGLPAPKYFMSVRPSEHGEILTRFTQGLIDLGTHGIPNLGDVMKTNPNIGTYLREPPYQLPNSAWGLIFNYRKPLFRDPALKLAIAYAIPYQDIIIKAWSNYSVMPNPTPLIDYYPAQAGYINWDIIKKYTGGDTHYNYDPQKAISILERAGYKKGPDGIWVSPNGQRVSFTIETVSGWSDSMMIADLTAQSLRNIGIDAKPAYYDYSVWLSHFTTGDFDISIGGGPGLAETHWFIYNTFRYFMDYRLTYPTGNPAGYNPPDAAKIAELIDALPTAIFDEAKFKEIVSSLTEYWMRDLIFIPVVYIPWWYQYNEAYWVGFPNGVTRPYTANWWTGPIWSHNKDLILFYLVPRGEYEKGTQPRIPSWMLTLPIPTSKILEDLTNIARATPTPPMMTTPPMITTTTVTSTMTMTQVATIVMRTTAITTTTVTQIEYMSTAIISIITLIVGLAIGWIVLGRRR